MLHSSHLEPHNSNWVFKGSLKKIPRLTSSKSKKKKSVDQKISTQVHITNVFFSLSFRVAD